MNELDLFIRFGAAMAIGFSIGLQREFAHGGEQRNIPAGERTLALVGIVGALAAMASDEFSQPLIFFGMLLAIGLLMVAGYIIKAQRGHFGMTTEAALMVTLMLGGLCYWGHPGVAAAIGVATTLVLSLKLETDRLVESITRQDVFAALQLAVISAIVLPILPNQSILPPPFDVLNPFKIWLMVVFISGLSFLGYIIMKLLKDERGIGWTGFLGGLVSSTAVTLSLAERSNKKKISRLFAYAIVLSWAVMVPRVLVQVGVVNWNLLEASFLPLFVTGVATLGYALFLYVARPDVDPEKIDLRNPFDLVSALKFGALYAAVLLVSRATQLYLGDSGLLVSSFLAGLGDVNAIALGLSELALTGVVDLHVAALGILLAVAANTLSKSVLVFVLGSPALKKAIWPGTVIISLAALAALFLFL